jgi:hypothetical protein
MHIKHVCMRHGHENGAQNEDYRRGYVPYTSGVVGVNIRTSVRGEGSSP